MSMFCCYHNLSYLVNGLLRSRVSVPLTLQGGWNTSFKNLYGTTRLKSAPKAQQGSLTLQDLNIRP